MTFWYVPSTYRGRRFGRGIRGYGRLAGGSLSGGVGLISVTDPVEAMENVETAAPPEEAAKIAEAEATGKPVVVKKETASALGNFARGAWNFAKKAAANPYVRTGAIVGATLLANHFGPGLMTKGYKLGKAAAYKMGNVLYNRLDNVYRDKPLYDIYEKDGKKYYKVAKQVTGATLGGETKRLAKDTGAFLFNKLNDFSGNRLLNGVSAVSRGWNTMKGWFSRGSGYGGYYGGRRGRFVKGSPEAKAYMAMLRARRRTGVGARRRTRRGRGMLALGYGGALGGMYPGYSLAKLTELYTAAQAAGDATIPITRYKKVREPNWLFTYDKKGNKILDANGNPVLKEGHRYHDVLHPDPVTGLMVKTYDEVLDAAGNAIVKDVPIAKIKNMIDNTNAMHNFWKYSDYNPATKTGNTLRTAAERQEYMKDYILQNRGKNFKPWYNISKKRFKRIQNAMNRSVIRNQLRYENIFAHKLRPNKKTGAPRKGSPYRKWLYDGDLEDDERYRFTGKYLDKANPMWERMRIIKGWKTRKPEKNKRIILNRMGTKRIQSMNDIINEASANGMPQAAQDECEGLVEHMESLADLAANTDDINLMYGYDEEQKGDMKDIRNLCREYLN